MTRKPITRRRLAAFAIVTPLLILALIEIGLRVVGFSFQRPAADHAMIVDLSNEAVNLPLLKRDAELIWRISPAAVYQNRTVNSLGFLDEHRSLDKSAGTIRVLCLGDSCTADGDPPYSKMLEQFLNENRPEELKDKKFEVINAGVWSYSSAQGFAVASTLIPALAPDIATIYYGLNDHTLTSSGLTDAEIFKQLREQSSASVAEKKSISLIHRLRLYQAINKSIHAIQLKSLAGEIRAANRVRVPLDQYEFNLEQIIEIARNNDAEPILLTFPQNFKPGGAMDFFAEHHILVDYDTFRADHARYVEATRGVAAKAGVPLVDLEKNFPAERDPLFITDGIHHTHAGREEIVRQMAAVILENLTEE